MSPTRSPNAPKCHTTNLLRVAPFTTEICVADHKTTFSLYTLCLPISLFRWFLGCFYGFSPSLSLSLVWRGCGRRGCGHTWRRTKSASSVNRQCLCSHKAKRCEPLTVVSFFALLALLHCGICINVLNGKDSTILASAIFILSGRLLYCISPELEFPLVEHYTRLVR